jgi:predicted anti-sigma-YlaC factor YlaD
MRSGEIVCREFAEMATGYLDGALPAPVLELVEEHLAMCDWCRDFRHQLETLARAVADAGRPEPDPETLSALREAFRRRRGAPLP